MELERGGVVGATTPQFRAFPAFPVDSKGAYLVYIRSIETPSTVKRNDDFYSNQLVLTNTRLGIPGSFFCKEASSNPYRTTNQTRFTRFLISTVRPYLIPEKPV